MKWIRCTENTFRNEDWEYEHYRYAFDHAKLETHQWDVEQGYLQKKGGTGTLAFSQIEWLDESDTSPSPSAQVQDIQCHCNNDDKHGETSIMCCNECGLPTEKFWQLGNSSAPVQPDKNIADLNHVIVNACMNAMAMTKDVSISDELTKILEQVRSFTASYSAAPVQGEIINQTAEAIVTEFDNHIADKDSTRAILKQAIETMLTRLPLPPTKHPQQ